MKKLLFVLFALLFSVTALAAPPPFTVENAYPNRDITAHGTLQIDINGVEQEMVGATTGVLVLYVDTALGDDTNDCLSSGAGACATIQSAIDRVPKYVNHNVSVFVAGGTYATAYISGFVIRNSATFFVRGVLVNSTTLATGTATGTADGGTTTTCVDSGQTWTVDDVIGHLVYVNGEYRVVYDNNGTTLYFRNPLSGTCNGQDYEIKDWTTFVQGVETNGGLGPITVENNDTGNGTIEISNISSINGEDAAFLVEDTDGITITRCSASGGNVYGYIFRETTNSMVLTCSYVTGATGYGIYASRAANRVNFTGNVCNSNAKGFFMDALGGLSRWDSNVTLSNTTSGLWFQASYGDLIVYNHYSDADDYGMIIGGTGSDLNAAGVQTLYVQSSEFSNGVTGGIAINNMSYVAFDTVTGTGNAGYGVDVRMGAHLVVDDPTTITGATDDATVNEGANDLTWATDFGTNRDVVVNMTSFSRIERRD
jgi:hypothetical protein